MWVKVCGMTRVVDVEHAVAAGADAVGFVIAENSKRRVDADMLERLVAVAGEATTVLVSANQEPADVVDLALRIGMDWVQPHGSSQDQVIASAMSVGLAVLVPVGVDSAVSPVDDVPASVPLLLDTKVRGQDGGTGVTFDWTLARGIDRRFVLAGGLGPANVADAIAAAQPWGVDAVTLLEAAPGVKDHTKVTDFIRKAKGL
ncbi:N-(5'-phosphoribosyl)anthranilate isomerase [bacterium BMS3Bbin02]|nr:N-(5'-phosphoribosyl)anthranilate isomerase [bacterium BMS3Bbin02]